MRRSTLVNANPTSLLATLYKSGDDPATGANQRLSVAQGDDVVAFPFEDIARCYP